MKRLSALAILITSLTQADLMATEPGWLGIRVCKRSHLVVQEVFPGTPAKEFGLHPGDQILTIEGEAGIEDIQDSLRNLGQGNPVRVRLNRSGTVEEISLMLAVRPIGTIPKGTTVYLPESEGRVAVKPGDPLGGRTCRSNCYARVPQCDPVVLDSQGPERSIVRWRGHLVTFEDDFRGITFLDKSECVKYAKEGCRQVL